MLDPIATDCMYLNRSELDLLWAAVFQYADGVFYISDFVAEAFHRRYRLRPGIQEMVTYLSLDYNDYRSSRDWLPGSYLLVVGNAFEHKRVPSTVDALSKAFPDLKIVALGLAQGTWPNVVTRASGELTDDQMEDLWQEARLVIFPSIYEGFGFPVLKALANGKPVLARSIPVTRAIREKLLEPTNLILYSSSEELVELLGRGVPVWKENAVGDSGPGWNEITERLGDFLRRLLRSFSFSDALLPRLTYRRLLQKSLGPAVIPVDPRALQGILHDSGVEVRQENDTHFEELRTAMDQLKTTIRDHEAALEQIRRSWSWRVTAPLRTIAETFFRIFGHRSRINFYRRGTH
jgi:glycosyltransferase involved in cell wall biosynthesis